MDSSVRVAVPLLLLALLLQAVPSQAQTTPAPAFTVGANKVYAHASADSLQVWMNTLVDDGGGTPYYFFGASAGTVPGVGAGYDFVQDADFEARIALTPALGQDIVLEGTVNVQAYIGGGTYTAGRATIGTSLVAGGAVLGSAAAKEHTMRPHQAGETYDAIAWTFTVPRTAIPAGTLLEWVIEGNVVVGNNVYLGAHEARGRSSIELPVVAASAVPGAGGSAIQHHNLNGTSAVIELDAANATTARHVYNWTSAVAAPELRLAANVTAGSVAIVAREDGALRFEKNLNASAVLTDALAGAGPGNWTFTLNLTAFQGKLTLTVGPALPAGTGGTTSTATSQGGTGGTGGTGGSNGTGAAASASGSSSTGKGTPGLGWVALAGLLAVAAASRRRSSA